MTDDASSQHDLDLGVFDKTPMFAPKKVTHVLDALATLQARRSALAASVIWGDTDDTRVIARGPVEINRWLFALASERHDLLSVRPFGRVDELRVSLPANRRSVEAGNQMTSVFDYRATTPTARLLLGAEPAPPTYLFAYAPLQMKIIDEEQVLLEGPTIDGGPTVMLTSDQACLTAALAYWRAVLDTSFPCSEAPECIPELTDRQRQVMALMSADLSDEQIAEAVGVSVRTVRSDIARVMAELGAGSRFSLGRAIQDRLQD
ncbi:helix-turn-helix transcriptional regulator [Nocardioides sp. CER19]|uniref:helix-turn-helix transcriptional regulator n=1 Tax=Nocardioides sp. CER19 TaxID=3038538 RepID=UPI00244783DD|nr:helix-turn-helix transcriptional regulator [Nocardioides sp. CER19]MDH2414611.1 helix-turn-helix transcriptional regulator [Nocardioides sp. CER19]